MKAALVVQRYGVEVNGGAEALARRVAELIIEDVDLTVLTTCALDYTTWQNHFPAGETDVNGVRVLRFPVSECRDRAVFDKATAKAYAAPDDLDAGRRWMRAQGPHSPDLLSHLEEWGHEYDVVAFVTYLYATTVEALPLVRDRALLLPAMHDEPPLALRIFREVFAAPRILLFSTPEERDVARVRFGVERDRTRIVGAGVDDHSDSDVGRFRATYGVEKPYALYVGRLDVSKGVPELAAFHATYRALHPDGLDLVLLGGGSLPLPREPWLHELGFVPEEAKHDAIVGADVVICPSPYESLSLVQIESWTHGRPTLSNAISPVLVGQSRRSGGGLWYQDAAEYVTMLDLLARNAPLAAAIGRQGRRHAHSAYSWERVREAWLAALEEVAEARRA